MPDTAANPAPTDDYEPPLINDLGSLADLTRGATGQTEDIGSLGQYGTGVS